MNESLPCHGVAGSRLESSLADFVRRCEVHIYDEQGKVLPDAALIATLCDAVRLAREYAASKGPPGRGANYCLSHGGYGFIADCVACSNLRSGSGE